MKIEELHVPLCVDVGSCNTFYMGRNYLSKTALFQTINNFNVLN